MIEFVGSIQNIFMPGFFNDANYLYVIKIILSDLPCIIVIGGLLLLQRSNFFIALRQILPSLKFIFIAMTAYLGLETVVEYFSTFISDNIPFWRPLYAVNCLFLILVISLIFWQYYREKKFQNSELLRLQQEDYLKRLEKVQLELRKVHHDYKNVATGLYAQVSAGDLAGAKTYLNEKFLRLDQNLQLDIHQLNQLANIEVIELKTLVISKLMRAEEMGVTITLEVLVPVKNVSMEIGDLLRCLGIVLDNAIEATEGTEEKTMHLLFLQEPELLTMVIKNPTGEQLDLQKIFQSGFSTKGANRGLGLSILEEISWRYHNFFVETRLEAGYLKQILLLHREKESSVEG